MQVLADILESLSGAICVDGGFDLSLVWEVFEPMLGPSISSRLVRLHPVRELQEVCQKNGLTWTKSPLPMGGRQCQYTFEICVDTNVVEGTAVSEDKKSAKRLAALDALEKLKVIKLYIEVFTKFLHIIRLSKLFCGLQALGYVHACKGETPASQKAKRRDAKSVKEPLDKLKLSYSPQSMSSCTPMFPTTLNTADSSTPLLPTTMNTFAGSSSHNIQDHTASLSEKFDRIWEFGDENKPQFREGPFDTLAKESSGETLGASNVDIEPQLTASFSATLAKELSDKLKMGHTHLKNKSLSVPLSSTASSDDVTAAIAGSSTHHLQDHMAGVSALSEKFERSLGVSNVNEPQFRVGMNEEEKYTEALIGHQAQTFSCIEDSTGSLWYEIEDQQISTPFPSLSGASTTHETTSESVAGVQGGYLQHSNMSMEDVWPRAWWLETNGVSIRNAANFHAAASVPAYITTDDMTTAAASRGAARSSLYEACARKRWQPPSFARSHEEGPPHDKW